MNITENQDLQSLNTLSLSQHARYFTRACREQDVREAVQFARERNLPWVVLGQGSNVVLQRDFPGLVIQNAIAGIDKLDDSKESVVLEVGAGENWHVLVNWCMQQGYYGLENLALIPGTVGAAPVQNIGAYGVEVCSFILHVKVFDTQQDHWLTLDNRACEFFYRDSVFKHKPNRFIITHVCLQLHKQAKVNVSYDALRRHFAEKPTVSITPQQVFDAVVQIRSSRLPDPAVLPNAGSFFKNPIISAAHYQILLKQYSELVAYPLAGKTDVKLAAAWLIDRAGWKGVREGYVGVHDQQALVLVNHGGANGKELVDFAEKIRRDIRQRYQVDLELEPTVI